MKMSKKFLSVICASCLFLTTTISAVAADAEAEEFTTFDWDATLQSAEQYAYLDIEGASPALQEKILEAREAIIFSQDWVADGYTGYVQDVTTGEILRYVPSFSELFPDWDIPVDETLAKAFSTTTFSQPFTDLDLLSPQSSSDWLRLGSFRHYLQAASTSYDATPFVTIYTDLSDVGSVVRTYATDLTSSETCNIGYNDASTGKSLGSQTYLGLNEAYVISNVGAMYLAVRASTFSIPGYATLAIDARNRIMSLEI